MINFLHKFWILKVLLLICVLSTKTVADEKAANATSSIMYFGFFFNETTASSLKNITDSYFNALSTNLTEFSNFLRTISLAANVTDPTKLYTKPVDPNSQQYDPFYHVTAKYCGDDQKACTEYEKKNANFIDKNFEMHLVGYVLTSRTFGIRVDLTTEQKNLFDADSKSSLSSGDANSRISFLVQSSLPDIRLEEQPFPPSLPVTSTKAHVTLGCAPGVKAVETGPDALEAIKYESNSSAIRESWDTIMDPMDEAGNNMTVTLYKPTTSAIPRDYAFIIYPRVKVIATATLKRYFHKPTSSVGNGLNGIHNLWLLSISILPVFFQYFHK